MDSEQTEDKKSAPAIRTMRSDAQLYVKEKKLSTIQIAATEYAKQSPLVSSAPSRAKNILVVAGAFVTLLVISGGIWFFIASRNTPAPEAKKPVVPASPIAIDGENEIAFPETSPGLMWEKINGERAKTFRENIIIYVPLFVERTSGSSYVLANDFFRFSGMQIPQVLQEQLTEPLYAFLFSRADQRDLVFVLEMRNFDRSLAALLSWERTMASDWRNLFSNNENIILLPRTFQDDTIRNNDARILRRSDGSVVMGYTIFNKKLVIVATSREALDETLRRLIVLPPR